MIKWTGFEFKNFGLGQDFWLADSYFDVPVASALTDKIFYDFFYNFQILQIKKPKNLFAVHKKTKHQESVK